MRPKTFSCVEAIETCSIRTKEVEIGRAELLSSQSSPLLRVCNLGWISDVFFCLSNALFLKHRHGIHFAKACFMFSVIWALQSEPESAARFAPQVSALALHKQGTSWGSAVWNFMPPLHTLCAAPQSLGYHWQDFCYLWKFNLIANW